MVNSVGKRLQQARLSQAIVRRGGCPRHAHPPRQAASISRQDNYSNFPSISYAKGFLLLYARFLGVDVSDFTDTLQAPNPVSTEDYDYLNAAASAPPPPPARRPYHFSPRRERSTSCP